MSKGQNSEDRFGGPYMIQDHDHMSEIGQGPDKANSDRVRQADQSHSSGRQQGGDDQLMGRPRQAN
jgi:hypothetical protein